MTSASIFEGPQYYFGYGTLLGAAEMLHHCPTATEVAVAGFANHRLEFWAYGGAAERVGCHLVRAQGDTAYGVVYSLARDELSALDQMSGVDEGWAERRPIEVVTVQGEPMVVTTHFLVDPSHPAAPPRSYRDLVKAGLRAVRLPVPFVERTTAYLDSLHDTIR